MALSAVASVVLAVVARGGQRMPVVSPIERSASIPFSFPRFPIRKDFKRQGWISPEIGGFVMPNCYSNGVAPGFTREATLTGFEPVLPP